MGRGRDELGDGLVSDLVLGFLNRGTTGVGDCRGQCLNVRLLMITNLFEPTIVWRLRKVSFLQSACTLGGEERSLISHAGELTSDLAACRRLPVRSAMLVARKSVPAGEARSTNNQ